MKLTWKSITAHVCVLSFILPMVPVTAFAETEAPFFPVVTFEKTVSLPAPEFVIAVDLKAPSATRAKEYRATWNGEMTKWLPLVNELRYPIPLDKKSVRRNHFEVQFRDASNKQSAAYRNSMEVLPFAYLQTPIPVAVSGQGCVDDRYDRSFLQNSYQFTLPLDLKFQIRHVLCTDSYDRKDSCTDPATITGLEALPWKVFDPLKPLEIHQEIQPYFYCRLTRVLVQTRDQMGFETKPFYLPK